MSFEVSIFDWYTVFKSQPQIHPDNNTSEYTACGVDCWRRNACCAHRWHVGLSFTRSPLSHVMNKRKQIQSAQSPYGNQRGEKQKSISILQHHCVSHLSLHQIPGSPRWRKQWTPWLWWLTVFCQCPRLPINEQQDVLVWPRGVPYFVSTRHDDVIEAVVATSTVVPQ